MRIALCSFAGGGISYRESVIRLEKQAILAGYFDSFYCYTDETAPSSLRDEFEKRKDFYCERGFGYWSWKPQLIEYSLEQIDDGDILFYMDAGCQISPYGYKRFKAYIDIIKRNNFLFFYMPPFLEKSYTAEKIVDLLKVPKKFLDSPQVQATFFGLKKTKESVELIKTWKSTCLTKGGYYVSDVNIQPSDPSFIDYRHDQSILSLLVKMRGYFCIPYECHHKPIEYYPNSSIMRFPIHSIRNRTGSVRDSHAFIYSSDVITNSDTIFYKPIKLIFKIIYLIPKSYRLFKNRWKNFKCL